MVATGIAGQAALPVAGALGVGGLGAAGALGMREAVEMMMGPPRCSSRQCVVGYTLQVCWAIICVYSESREVLPGEVSERNLCLSTLLNKIRLNQSHKLYL